MSCGLDTFLSESGEALVYLPPSPENQHSQSQRQQNRGSSCQDREASNRPNDNKHCRIEALLAVQDGLSDLSGSTRKLVRRRLPREQGHLE